MAEAKGIAMTVETPAAPTPVRLDPMRMRQVLWNLVHNAVKFTPKGGSIRVEAVADEAGAVFSVVDNGVGVDAKDLPFIFERFRQVDGSATRAYRGMGIGLALAKAYVELHGGTITVDSQPGKGTPSTCGIPRTASTGFAGSSAARLTARPEGIRTRSRISCKGPNRAAPRRPPCESPFRPSLPRGPRSLGSPGPRPPPRPGRSPAPSTPEA